jgi:hypothetical protein
MDKTGGFEASEKVVLKPSTQSVSTFRRLRNVDDLLGPSQSSTSLF